jgi:tRNA threonylcarbamoyl adenosine modification protein YeaZ
VPALILGFDTATPAVTVALHDGSRAIAQESAVDSRRHGELLAPAIAKVLAVAGVTPADLTAIAVGTGPGPYTGLRVGLVTAQVLGSALGIVVDGICTLDVIAAQASRAAAGREFIVATDARRREVYWARYSAAGVRLSVPAVSLPADLPTGYPMAGEGAMLYADLLGSQRLDTRGLDTRGLDTPGAAGTGSRAELIEPRYPDAATLASIAADHLARGIPAGRAEPLYLRRPDAREPGRPKRVSPAGKLSSAEPAVGAVTR